MSLRSNANAEPGRPAGSYPASMPQTPNTAPTPGALEVGLAQSSNALPPPPQKNPRPGMRALVWIRSKQNVLLEAGKFNHLFEKPFLEDCALLRDKRVRLLFGILRSLDTVR